MSQLIWSSTALQDVERLHQQLLDDNHQEAAMRVVKKLRIVVKLISIHPQIGPPAEAMAAEFHEWPIDFSDSGYIVLYRYSAGQTIILTIRHQKEVGH